MITIDVLCEELALWQKMIEVAEKLPKNKLPYLSDINYHINADWSGYYSPLCQKYIVTKCTKCPLAKHYDLCDNNNSNYLKICNAQSWKEWIRYARVMVKQLKGCIRKECVEDVK